MGWGGGGWGWGCRLWPQAEGLITVLAREQKAEGQEGWKGMGKGKEKTEGPQALTKSSCGVVGVKAQCAFKLLSKTDLNGDTCGSAKTSVLAIWETDQQSIIFILPVFRFIIHIYQKHGSSAGTGYFFVNPDQEASQETLKKQTEKLEIDTNCRCCCTNQL